MEREIIITYWGCVKAISSQISGFSFRYCFAFSRPWPILSPLYAYHAPDLLTTSEVFTFMTLTFLETENGECAENGGDAEGLCRTAYATVRDRLVMSDGHVEPSDITAVGPTGDG